MTPLKLWMKAATPDEQKTLAHKVGTTRTYLYHLAASEDRDYRREPKPVLAAAIERVTAEMHKLSKGRLPRIYRTDLVKACAQCEFAQRCLGAAAVRADFQVVTPEALAAAGSEN